VAYASEMAWRENNRREQRGAIFDDHERGPHSPSVEVLLAEDRHPWTLRRIVCWASSDSAIAGLEGVAFVMARVPAGVGG
jgi:hypothetical protein